MGLPTTRLGRKWVLVGLAKTELILPGPPSSAFVTNNASPPAHSG